MLFVVKLSINQCVCDIQETEQGFKDSTTIKKYREVKVIMKLHWTPYCFGVFASATIALMLGTGALAQEEGN